MWTTLKLVIFDMDGLMLDTEKAYFDACIQAVRRKNIQVDESYLLASIGSTFFDMDGFLCHKTYETLDVEAIMEESLRACVEDMCKKGAPKKKGLNELMEFLAERQIPMVVATSTERERAERLLKSASVGHRLRFILSGREVKRGKPFPDIFQEACKKAGVMPGQALVLEDSTNGALAAEAAGIPYILVPDMIEPTLHTAENALAVLRDLGEVKRLLEKEVQHGTANETG